MGFSGLCMGFEVDNDDPTPDDIGRFIPQPELQAWWAYMQRRYPHVFPASDPCPSRQWPKDTKIRNYFDGDRSKEMNAIILGSKMTAEPYSPSGEEYPAYVVRCPPSSSDLSYIHLTDVHEEDGWKVVQEEPARQGNTSLPSPDVIKIIALEYSYEERRDEASSTLFFKDTSTTHNPTLINVFYTTGGVMTKLRHPSSGYNQLWRRNAYDSVASLAAIFENPRVHTGKGYRNAGNAVRGCVKCGEEKKRADFSNNQWRKGQGESKCTSCVQSQRQGRNNDVDASNEIRWESIIDSITCDAEGCLNTSPAYRCQSCCMVYYCSDACRRSHQREHSQECVGIDVMRLRTQMSGSDVNLRSGLCNAKPSTLSQLRGQAMATQLSGNRSVDSLLLQAEYIHQADENWEQALHLYHNIMMEFYGEDEHSDMATPSQWRQMFMGLSRCSFELGMYDKCISAGSGAVEMNRHFPQVHRYIALAHAAKGDHDEALKTMKQAILYEAPWCDETAQLNKDLLRGHPFFYN